ncbi:MAG: hypothetical protein JST62_05035 [Bacteroidetes bacterium]|nr:hypothetical protein [Bacteroidota bacterium]
MKKEPVKYKIWGVYNNRFDMTAEERKQKLAELDRQEDRRITITAFTYLFVFLLICIFSYCVVTYFLGPMKF